MGSGICRRKIKTQVMKLIKLNEDHYILVDGPNKKMFPTSEAKELIDVVDVENKAFRYTNRFTDYLSPKEFNCMKESYVSGYNQALEDNKDRKYTEEDMQLALYEARCRQEHSIEEIIQVLQPKTEWEVEFIDGKLKLKQ